MKHKVFLSLLIFVSVSPSFAQGITTVSDATEDNLDLNYAHVLKVKTLRGTEAWRFDVTIRHKDEGWDHYANLWVVIDAETGAEYGRRVLSHPHVNEQPFSRSQSGIRIPENVTSVIVKAACTLHGFGGTELEVKLR